MSQDHSQDPTYYGDWSANLDDFDSDYWEKYLGGPDVVERDPPTEPDDLETPDDGRNPEISSSRGSMSSTAQDHSSRNRLSRSAVNHNAHTPSTSSPSKGRGTQRRPTGNHMTSRQAEIMDWLVQSRSTRELRSGDGFYVTRGSFGRTPEGTIIDLIDWLQEEGFTTGRIIGEYRIAYTPPGGPYLEKLTFFCCVEEIPFSRITPDSVDANEPTDYAIPF